MEKLQAYLRLIRAMNLVFIILTQYFTRYFLIIPVLNAYNIRPVLDHGMFALLTLATVLVAAAGYMINDYFDVNIDYVNKPKKITINRFISRRSVMAVHLAFNALGVILALFVGFRAGDYKLGFIFVVSAGLLWFYSTSFKKQFLIGNVIVSFLTGLTVLIVALFEKSTLFYLISIEQYMVVRVIMIQVLGYAFFAFWISLIREIVKDMEDMEGDKQFDCQTLPIVLGLPVARWIVVGLILAMVIGLGVVQRQYAVNEQFAQIAYIFMLIQLPSLYLIFLMQQADNPKALGRVSDLVKGIMFLGIASMAVFSLMN